MRRFCLAAVGIAMLASIGVAQTPSAGPYKVLKAVKVGGEGSFDYVYADVNGRRLYIPRGSTPPHVTVFNLDTLAPAGDIPGIQISADHPCGSRCVAASQMPFQLLFSLSPPGLISASYRAPLGLL